jgi:hypothetical protein
LHAHLDVSLVVFLTVSLFEVGNPLALLLCLFFKLLVGVLLLVFSLEFSFLFNLLLQLQLLQEVFVSHEDAVGIAYIRLLALM